MMKLNDFYIFKIVGGICENFIISTAPNAKFGAMMAPIPFLQSRLEAPLNPLQKIRSFPQRGGRRVQERLSYVFADFRRCQIDQHIRFCFLETCADIRINKSG